MRPACACLRHAAYPVLSRVRCVLTWLFWSLALESNRIVVDIALVHDWNHGEVVDEWLAVLLEVANLDLQLSVPFNCFSHLLDRLFVDIFSCGLGVDATVRSLKETAISVQNLIHRVASEFQK